MTQAGSAQPGPDREMLSYVEEMLDAAEQGVLRARRSYLTFDPSPGAVADFHHARGVVAGIAMIRDMLRLQGEADELLP